MHVSSLAAIGPSTDGKPVSDDAEPHPLTHYGISKLEGERIVRALVPDAVIVRPAAVYGPRDMDVLEVFRSISRGFVLEISGGERWFQAIYVKDLADGLLAAARTPQADGRAYGMTGGPWAALVQAGSFDAMLLARTKLRGLKRWIDREPVDLTVKNSLSRNNIRLPDSCVSV